MTAGVPQSGASRRLIEEARARRLVIQTNLEMWGAVPGYEWLRDAVGQLLQAHAEELARVVERSDCPNGKDGPGMLFAAVTIREYTGPNGGLDPREVEGPW